MFLKFNIKKKYLHLKISACRYERLCVEYCSVRKWEVENRGCRKKKTGSIQSLVL
jgi:hypothetical protein